MGYATVHDLAKRASLDDLAQAASPDGVPLTGHLLEHALEYPTLTADALRALRNHRAPRFDEDALEALPAALARLETALTDADAEIDGYLSGRYPTPEATPRLRVLATDIALWRLIGGDADSETRQRYDAAVRYLRDVARGAIDLTAAAASDADVQVEAPARIFSHKRLANY